jgi:hypothetical protein
MKRLIFVLPLVFIFLKSYPQNNVQVSHNYDASGNAIFTADNYLPVPVYLVLNFSYLNYASFSGDLPYIKRVDPGSTQLFTIFRDPGQPSPNFNIEYKWLSSNPNPKVDLHFPYLIPAKPGTLAKVTEIITKTGNKPSGFVLEQPGEVCASRKGTVINVSEEFDPSLFDGGQNRQNFVDILHDDGTIGEYTNFAYKGVDCEVGQKVFPGQELGKAAPIKGNPPVVGFSVFHESANSKNMIYIPVEFCIDKSKVSGVGYGKEYKVANPIEIVTKELSRKEQKALKLK